MSERKINLEEILFKHLSKAKEILPNENWYSDEEIKNSPEFSFFKDAMKEACQQTLELVAEKATTILHKSGKQIEVVTPVLEPPYYEKGNGDLVPQGYAQVGTKRQLKYENEIVVVDKNSILNLINQIE